MRLTTGDIVSFTLISSIAHTSKAMRLIILIISSLSEVRSLPVIKNTPASRKALGQGFRMRPFVDEGLPILEEWDLEMEASDQLSSVLFGEGLTELQPSEFVEFAVKMPNHESKQLEPFSFGSRRYLRSIYDTTSPRVLLKCGRQVEKSTYLGNRLLALTCIQPSFTALYVSPTNQQSKTFSNDRIKEPIETSARLRAWTTDKLAQNVFQKKFINRSQIVLRYAFLNADRVRGIPADMICIDEIQDIHTDSVPVIE
jgi:hypothetical protein